MVLIHVIYWGGWGYKAKADRFIAELGKLCTFEHTMEPKIGHSGAFEVYVEEELVHSKLNGQGYVNEEKLKAIAAFVSERLKK